MLNIFKTFKPRTPGIRSTRLLNKFNLLKKTKPLKSLTKNFNKSYGKNNQGILTNWNKGSGHKRLYRKIDFHNLEFMSSFGIVEGLEYDPNRNSRIIRIFNPDEHNHRYTLEIKTIKQGSIVGRRYTNLLGTHTYLKNVPIGFVVSNLSSGPDKPRKYLRSAGTYGQIIQKIDGYTRIKLRSGEHRIFSSLSKVTLGTIGNIHARDIKLGKAGRNRWYGKNPTVRGVAINPVDHPHGGGEGKTSGGKQLVTPWGKLTKNQSLTKQLNKIRVKFRSKS